MPFIINSRHTAPLIFDLGGVLIETNYLYNFLKMGPLRIATSTITFQNPLASHLKLLHLLHELQSFKESYISRDPYGNMLPQIMCNWLKGTQPAQEILELIKMHTAQWPWIKRSLVEAVASLIFSPALFANTRSLVPEGIEFIKNCKKNGHDLYILSNWDPESFVLLKKLYPDFFNLFSGIVISGNTGLLKPNPAAFENFINHFALDSNECIFIDDSIENILAAQKYGIKSIHYQKQMGFLFRSADFQSVRKKITLIEQSKKFPILIHENGY